MAKFEEAEEITGRNEGGYANNPADTGGETYAGISRNNWPKWQGWVIIDQIKRNGAKTDRDINKKATSIPELTNLISEFYRKNFWDTLKLSAITDQQLANNVYDFGVNSGIRRAGEFLQRAANDTGIVNLVVDGVIGPKSIAAINDLNPQNIYINYNRRREAFYRKIGVGPQAQFLKSWLSRLKPYHKC